MDLDIQTDIIFTEVQVKTTKASEPSSSSVPLFALAGMHRKLKKWGSEQFNVEENIGTEPFNMEDNIGTEQFNMENNIGMDVSELTQRKLKKWGSEQFNVEDNIGTEPFNMEDKIGIDVSELTQEIGQQTTLRLTQRKISILSQEQ